MPALGTLPVAPSRGLLDGFIRAMFLSCSFWRICRTRIWRRCRKPRWSELIGKRATGYLNWRRRRHLHPSRRRARTHHRRPRGAAARSHRGDRRSRQHLARRANTRRRARWLESLGPPHDVTLVPGNHDTYVQAPRTHAQLHWGDYMRGDDGGGSFPFLRRRGPLALIGLSSRTTDGAVAGNRAAWRRADRAARRRCSISALTSGAFAWCCFTIRREQAQAEVQTAARWRRSSRDARAPWRRAGHSRPRP